MAYQQLEDLRSRRREKVALFLTAENLFGIIAVVVPIYLGTVQFAILLRVLLLAGAVVLGVVLTSEADGMPIYERLLWRLRGRVRLTVAGRTLTPEQFVGTVSERPERALPVGSPLRLVRDDELAVRRSTHARGPAMALHAVSTAGSLDRDTERVMRMQGQLRADL